MYITIVELSVYQKRAEKYLAQESQDDVITYLATNPKAGRIIQGTGGFRKLRWARASTGKSGGVRIIYYFYNETIPLFLFDVYAKNEKENLSKKERNELAKLGKILVETYRRKNNE